MQTDLVYSTTYPERIVIHKVDDGGTLDFGGQYQCSSVSSYTITDSLSGKDDLTPSVCVMGSPTTGFEACIYD